MFKTKLLVFGLIVFLLVLFFYFDLNRYFDLNLLISQKQEWDSFYSRWPVWSILAFFALYVFCAAFSIPGAAVLTLSAGFLFDFIVGSCVVSLGSTAGAVIAFLVSRFLLRDFVQTKFQSRLKAVNKGLKKDGAFYVFSLRLIPVFPYFMVNLLMGVTPVSTGHFAIASFLGMLPATFVYVNAGTQLGHVKSLTEIISLPIILSFILLAGLPWIIKGVLKLLPFKKTVHSE